MANHAQHGMSRRGWANIEVIMPKIKHGVEQRTAPHNDMIDLSTAENWLIRSELIEICKSSITQELVPQHFSYPKGLSGDPEVLNGLCHLFNMNFCPRVPVVPSQVATGPGATACIDALLYNICDPGDGVLVPSPYWNGFDFGMRVRSSVRPVVVTLSTFGANFDGTELLPALERAYESADCQIKALMLTNPHNPLAVCYPRAIMQQCLRFCKKHNIHFISDEVYALSIFHSPDLIDPEPFTSVLSLDLEDIGVDKSRVHMIWSTSKDFGQSGLRLGCTVTQFHSELAVAIALAANTQVSALTGIFVSKLLMSPQLPSIIALNSKRLAAAYTTLTSFFKAEKIPYLPCNAGLYVYAKLAPDAETWEAEAAVVSRLKDAGVLVSSGKAYCGPKTERGWARVGFAVEEDMLAEAIRRMRQVLVGGKTE